MSPSSAAAYPAARPKKPKWLAMLIGFVLSTLVGILIGQISSFLYALIGGISCLTAPAVLLVFGGSTALSFLLTRILFEAIL